MSERALEFSKLTGIESIATRGAPDISQEGPAIDAILHVNT